MRSAKETGCFPYSSSVVCYFEIFSDGSIKQLTNKNEKLNAYVNANSGKSTIYAVWPGKWHSDLEYICLINHSHMLFWHWLHEKA